MKKIKVWISKKNNKFVYSLVDNEDFYELNQFSWFLDNFGYAKRTINNGKKKITIRIHRFLMKLEKGNKLKVDHMNHNKLDNRKSNLRICQHYQNIAHSKMYSHNTSGFRGVYICKRRNKWIAQINVLGKHISIGSYTSAESAAGAYNEKALKYFGSFAFLNKV